MHTCVCVCERQTCGQRSSMSAGSKHRVLAFYFSIRICQCSSRRSQDQILLLEKVSDSPNFFWEFVFPISVLLCSFLGLWSRFIHPPLQSLVNQYFSQKFERLFPKNSSERKSPRGWDVVKCREFERKNVLTWVASVSRDYWVYFESTWRRCSELEFWGAIGEWRDFSLSKFDPATGLNSKCRGELDLGLCTTGWQRLIGSPKLQIIFHKRATEYRLLLRKIMHYSFLANRMPLRGGDFR